MNPFYPKFRLIFRPFLIIAGCTIALYTFLNWLLVVQLHTVKLEEFIPNFIIPFVLPWIPLLIWQRPRLKLLNLKKGYRKDPVFGILLLNWLTMAVPLISAQVYMITATGRLTRLDYASEIMRFPETKYYTVKHFYTNKRLVHIKTIFTVSGKNSNDFNMDVYAPVPVFDHLFPDTNMITALRNSVNAKALVIIDGNLNTMQRLKKLHADSIVRMRVINPSMVMPKYGEAGKYGALAVITRNYKTKTDMPRPKMSPVFWLAVKFSKTISNHLSPAEKERLFKEFFAQTSVDFDHLPVDKFVYLNRITYSRDVKNYTAAVESRGDVDTPGAPVILEPVFGRYEDRNGNSLAWMLVSFAIGSCIFLIVLLMVKLKEDEMAEENVQNKNAANDIIS